MEDDELAALRRELETAEQEYRIREETWEAERRRKQHPNLALAKEVDEAMQRLLVVRKRAQDAGITSAGSER